MSCSDYGQPFELYGLDGGRTRSGSPQWVVNGNKLTTYPAQIAESGCA